jgi:hypothetical protein
MTKFEEGKSYKNAFGDQIDVLRVTPKTVVVYNHHAQSSYRKMVEIIDGNVQAIGDGIGIVRADIVA